MAIIKLKLREDSKKGFQVTLKETNRDDDIEGNLSPLPKEIDPTEEKSAFCLWQSGYREEEEVRSSYTSSESKTRITPIGIKYSSPEEYAKYAEDVKTYLNQWLNSGDNEWLKIRDELVAICSRLKSASDEVGVLLDVKNIDLCRLPWQEWNFFENHCPQAEIVFRLPKSKDPKHIIHAPSSSKVRILVAVGRNNGINTDRDLEEIQRLEDLGVAEVKYLKQPKREVLCDALWDKQGYHIFVFTGHSSSREDGQIGWIEVNDQESLSIEDFKNALKEAINTGLQLAIFNSCDGLGLANQLAQLHLPQSIVMREPVPDQVAVKFLKYFFQEFTHGQSLFTAVHRSRKRLEDVFKSRYPGVNWLPVICVSHNVKKLLTWQDLCKDYTAYDGREFIPEKDEKPEPPVVTPAIKPMNGKRQQKPPVNRRKFIAGFFALGFCGAIVLLWLRPKTNFRDVWVPKGEWSFGGSTSWAKINDVVHRKIQQELPQINFKYVPHPTPGSTTGIKMLLDNQISFAQSSRSLNDEEWKKDKEREDFKLKQIDVVRDVIAIVVHHDLNISNLTRKELRGIYTGKITDWSQVGGPNRKITPYSRPEAASGTTKHFKENVLEGQGFGPNVQYLPDTTTIQKIIGKSDSGGIYYLTPSEISKSLVKPLRINGIESTQAKYPIDRRLFVIIREDDTRDAKIGKAYVELLLTKEGQDLIKKALQE